MTHNMSISYNKFWESLIDKNMKSDLKEKAGISSASIAKIGKAIILPQMFCYRYVKP